MLQKNKIDLLIKNDPVMATIIKRSDNLEYKIQNSNYFKNASRIIVGQQLSVKAARTIWKRLDQKIVDWTPDNVATIDIDLMRSAGISRQKSQFIKELATLLKSKSLSFVKIAEMADEEALISLMSIKGFGKWSAEMFLIFSLGREDIFSFGDAGLRRAVMKAYKLDKQSYIENIADISDKWFPYRSIASLYLWAWIDMQE